MVYNCGLALDNHQTLFQVSSMGVRFERISELNPQPVTNGPITWAKTRSTAQFWTYRLSAYILLNVVDDPVWLALVFC